MIFLRKYPNIFPQVQRKTSQRSEYKNPKFFEIKKKDLKLSSEEIREGWDMLVGGGY